MEAAVETAITKMEVGKSYLVRNTQTFDKQNFDYLVQRASTDDPTDKELRPKVEDCPVMVYFETTLVLQVQTHA